MFHDIILYTHTYTHTHTLTPSLRAVGGVPTSVFYPVLTWVLLIVLFIYWGVFAVYPFILDYTAFLKLVFTTLNFLILLISKMRESRVGSSSLIGAVFAENKSSCSQNLACILKENCLNYNAYFHVMSNRYVNVSWPELPSLSFLVTASEKTYVIVMNGSATEENRNLTGEGKGLDGIIVTNGTPCDNQVTSLHNITMFLALWWVSWIIIC